MKISGMERNKYGEPIDHYWKWIDYIEQNTTLYTTKLKAARKHAAVEQVQIHIPDDPELFACFFWD